MLGSAAVTVTVAENKAVNTRKVEHHEVAKRRRVGTRRASVVPELNNEANGGEGAFFEVAAIPFLRCVSGIPLQ